MRSKYHKKIIDCTDLSYREIYCLRLSAQDKNCKEIAELLFISEKTVETHLKRIRQKLECTTIQGAVFKAIHYGLL